jgi:hypothetical protein
MKRICVAHGVLEIPWTGTSAPAALLLSAPVAVTVESAATSPAASGSDVKEGFVKRLAQLLPSGTPALRDVAVRACVRGDCVCQGGGGSVAPASHVLRTHLRRSSLSRAMSTICQEARLGSAWWSTRMSQAA